MIRVVAIFALLTSPVLADVDASKGEAAFASSCARCHSPSRSMMRLDDLSDSDAETYLRSFLPRHRASAASLDDMVSYLIGLRAQ